MTMALWLNRAGRHGEHEQKFLDDGRIYLTREGLDYDLSTVGSKAELSEVLRQFYPASSDGKIAQNTGQLWRFISMMKPGDWVVLPSQMKRAIHFGEIKGPYTYDPNAADPYYHYRDVEWLATDVPRSNFKQDLLYSFGAATTICGIKRNEAEKRVRAIAQAGWKPEKGVIETGGGPGGDEEEGGEETVDLELLARDRIAKQITREFKGHAMARLVDALLNAQGYTTYRSPEGPDKGVDILAATGPLGFGHPRICVQVKSGDAPVDRPTLDQLIGAMQNVGADQGLLVSWGGFKASVDRETAHHFFRVRLWDQDDLIDQLLEQYANLDEDLRTELPLKRIWTVAAQEEEE
jgi:restriction system protein